MTKLKITTKYYIRVHDRNLPGDSGWKVEFEIQSGKIKEFFTPEILQWVDKFVTYEKIFQEVWDEKGYRNAYTKPIGFKEFDVKKQDGKFVFIEKKEEKELTK